MLRLLHGRPIDGRLERLLDAALVEDRGAGCLHVVRTRPRERQLRERERANDCRVGSTVTTLPALVRRLAARRGHPRAALGEPDRVLILDEIARVEARPPLRRVAGLAAWLGALFSRLKQGDVFTEARAWETFRSLDASDAGVREALRLFGVYQARLVELDLYDDDGLYLEVARDLGAPELPFDRLAKVRRRLVVEGFYQTNVVERAVFERLFEAFEETLWLVDRAEDVPADGASVYDDLDAGGARFDGDLAWLRQRGARVLQADAPPAPEAAPPVLVTASTERVEAQFLVERAAALLRADPASDVVIAYPSDREAAALVREACGDVGLPLEAAPGGALREHPVARVLLDLLALSSGGLRRERIVAALQAAPGGVRVDGARLVAARVDRVARQAGVIAGATDWDRKLARHAACLARERDAAAAAGDAGAVESQDRRLREVEEVRAGIAALDALLPPAEGVSTIAAFVARAETLLELFGFDDAPRVPAGPRPPEVVEAAAASARARAAVRDVLDAYRRSAALASAPERATAHHVDCLRALMAAVTVPPPPPGRRGVRLLGIRDVRGLVTDHLLVGGLAEDAFPGPSDPVPLLSEADAARAGVRTQAARRREAAHLLAHACASPRRSLVLSRATQKDGAEVLPALALEALARTAAFGTLDADAELRTGTVGGRSACARQLARAVVRGDDPAPRWAALAAAGAALPQALHRVRVERARCGTRALGRFEGMLEPAATPLLLGEETELAMSASRFEDYVKCPLNFFFKRVLGLRAPDATDRDVSALDGGSIVHAILYRFHATVPAGAAFAERAAALERIALEELGRVRTDGLFAEVYRDRMLAGLRTPGPAADPGILRAYLDFEASRTSGFRPALVEARFGPAPTPLAAESVIGGAVKLFSVAAGGRVLPVRLSGSIDRVDVKEDGDVVRALVLDYKTGKAPAKAEVRRGLVFQLPLYMHVLEQVAAAKLGKRIALVGAAYYEVRGPGETGFATPLVEKPLPKDFGRRIGLEPGELAPLVQAGVRRARAVVEAWLAGRFHPTALDGSGAHCGMCDFRDVCRGRGEAARIARMDGAGLFPQIEQLKTEEDDA